MLFLDNSMNITAGINIDTNTETGTCFLVIEPSIELEWERMQEYDWRTEFPIDSAFTYDELYPSAPSEIYSIIFDQNGEKHRSSLFDSTEGAAITVYKPGTYNLLFYGYETGKKYVFEGLDEASSNQFCDSEDIRYLGNNLGTTSEYIAKVVDPFFACYYNNVTFEKQVQIENYPILLQPLTYKYLLRFGFDRNIDKSLISKLNMTVSGFAKYVYLKNSKPASRETATYNYTLEDFNDSNFRTSGNFIEVVINTLGVVNPDSFNEPPITVSLSITYDEIDYDYEFEISSYIYNLQPKGGIVELTGIEFYLKDPDQVFTISFETDNPNYEVQLVSGSGFYQSNKLEFQVNYGDSFYNAIGAESSIQVAVVPKASSQLIGDEEGTDGAKEWKCFDKDGNELLWGNYEQTSLGLSQLLSDSTIHIYKDHRFVAYCV